MRSREARKSRAIRRFRVLLLLALMATVAVLSFIFVRGRLEQEPPPESEPVGPETLSATGDMVTVGEGFERTVTEEDRSLFTVRGASYAVDRQGQVYLDDVEVTVFGDDGEEYEIRGPEAWFRPDEREARLTGGVTLSGPDGLEMETDTLRVTQKGRQIQSRGPIYIRLGERLHARANQLKVSLRGRQFHLVGHARVASLESAEVPFEITARLITIDRSRHLIEAQDGPVRLYHRDDWLVGNHVMAFLDEAEERVRYLRADDRVLAEIRPRPADRYRAGPEARQERAGAWPAGDDPFARRPAERLGRSAERGLMRIHAQGFEMEMTPDGLDPAGIHLSDGPGGRAVLRSFPAGPGPMHRLRAPVIEGRFEEGIPAEVTAGDGVELVVIEEGRVETEAAVSRELAAWVEEGADTSPPGEAFSATAEEEDLDTADLARVERRATGRRAEAAFDDVGELSTVTLFDRVVITDVGTEGETRAQGAKAVFRADADEVEVTGNPARIVTPRVEMDAPTVLYTRAAGILHGTGGVRARMQELEGTALGGTPLAEGEGPIRVEAEEGFFRDKPRSFLFRGSVRAWRGEDLITADELRGDEDENRLLAKGAVRTLWRPEQGAAVLEEGGGPIEVAADTMRFRQDRRILVYTGDVVTEQQDRVLSCQEMRLFLAPEEAESKTIERLVCIGEVVVTEPADETDGARTLRGHEAIYLPAERTVEVIAAPDGTVIMEDPEGNIIEGPRMIYEIDRDRVQVLPRSPAPAEAVDTEGPEEPDSGDPSESGEHR